jgi:amino acid transporter
MIPLLVPGLICGIGCVTAPSRCTWAFRDGCIPDSGWWKTVHKKLDIPFNALVLDMVVEIYLGLIYFGS